MVVGVVWFQENEECSKALELEKSKTKQRGAAFAE
jgi:hypothetical protein